MSIEWAKKELDVSKVRISPQKMKTKKTVSNVMDNKYFEFNKKRDVFDIFENSSNLDRYFYSCFVGCTVQGNCATRSKFQSKFQERKKGLNKHFYIF